MNTTNATSVSSTGDDGTRGRTMRIILLSIGAATVLMNAFVILLIVGVKSMRSNSIIIIGSMAVSDFMVGVATINAGILKWSDWFHARGVTCQITLAFDCWAAYASLAHVLAVNLERYLAIVFPLRYKHIVSVRRIQMALLLIWVISLAEGTAFSIAYELGEHCILASIVIPGLGFGMLVVSLAFPLLTVVGIYIHIVVVVIIKLRFMAKTSSLGEAVLAQSQRKMFVTVSVILAAWIICWLPLLCVVTALTFTDSLAIPLNVSHFLAVLSYSNSLLNPILYFLTSSDFRKAAMMLFRCKSGDGPNTQTASSVTRSTRFKNIGHSDSSMAKQIH